uniref:Defensin-like protein n=1 Tax=Solanum lycopersicum TaxID=4081 RepID=A0A3Q7ECZ7_SOLLC
MKNFSTLAVFVFSLFIILVTTTKGAKVCLFSFEVPQPCDSNNCNIQCKQQFGAKPPGAVKGPLLGGNCIGENCFCSFCCKEKCADLHS